MKRVCVQVLLSALSVLSLTGSRVFCQKINYCGSASRIAQPDATVYASFQNDPNSLSVFEVDYAPTGTGPCFLVNDVVISRFLSWATHFSCDVSLGCEGGNKLKRKPSKGRRRSVWPFLDIEDNRCNVLSVNPLTTERVFDRLAHRQIENGIAIASSKSERLKVNVTFKLPPSMIRYVDCRE